MINAIKIYDAETKKKELIVTEASFLNRDYWSQEAVDFLVYSLIGNKSNFYGKYRVNIDHMIDVTELPAELLEKALNNLLKAGLIYCDVINRESRQYEFGIKGDN